MSSGSRGDGTLSIEVAPPGGAAAWNDFVAQQPAASYCHRWEWRQVAEAAYDRSCTYLIARRTGRTVGVLPLVWMPERIAGHRLVSLPYLDMGGPLTTGPAVESALIHAALNLAESLGARSVELREAGGSDPDPEGCMRYRLVLDLPAAREALWRALHPKVRNQIRKADKLGLSSARVAADRLSSFYAVFGCNMRDLGSPVHSRRFLEEIFERFGNDARLYLTRDGAGRTVAGAIAISFRDQLIVPWASALRSARRSCPNHSLYWTILEDAIEAGVSSFDFGRSSAGTGTFRFKKQWGATPVPLAWRRVDRSGSRPEPPAARSPADRLLIAVWRRLPLALANRLGPLVRGRLPH